MDDDRSTAPASHWDPLRLALRARRAEVGNPSYAALAERIGQARVDAGADEHAARVARSTVYDAFTLGRVRINLPLVREIAAALDAEDQVDEWVARCHRSTHSEAAPEPEASPEPEVRSEPEVLAAAAPARSSGVRVAALLAACVALNLLGRVVVDVLHLPVYLDMVGTAVAAIALGPWRGAAVGLTTNLLAVATSGLVSIPFAVVNVVGALVWGYGARRLGWARTLPRFLGLNLVVAVACSVVAVPILVLGYGGSVGQGQDSVAQTFAELGHGLLAAVGLANLMTSTADKLISGFVALVAVSTLPRTGPTGSTGLDFLVPAAPRPSTDQPPTTRRTASRRASRRRGWSGSPGSAT